MPEINGRTSPTGLIGNPVEHTLSPLIHHSLAAAYGVNTAYLPFLVRQDGLAAALEGAYELNIRGLNVTVPYKERVIDCLAGLQGDAEKIRAVNTLVRGEGGYIGYNTDISGLSRAMSEEGIEIRGRDTLVLGAGGAAKAAVYLLAKEGAASIYILNRTFEKAVLLADEVGTLFGGAKLYPMALADYRRLPDLAFTAVQTTSAGLYPDLTGAPILDEAFYRKIAVAVDLIYNPWNTRFMRETRCFGGLAVNGLRMLLYQAADAFALFHQVQPKRDVTEQIYGLLMKEFSTDE